MKEILKELNKIDFHDIPARDIKIIFDPDFLVIVSFFLHNDESNIYQNKELFFKGITNLEIGNMLLDSDSEIEIDSFDYEYNEGFDCKMGFLLGFGKPSLEMEIKCEKIEIKTVPNKKLKR